LILAMLLVAGAGKATHRWASVMTRIALVLFWTFPLYFVLVKWHCLYLMAPVLLALVSGAIEQARHSHTAPETASAVVG
jgi:hypothetical protein